MTVRFKTYIPSTVDNAEVFSVAISGGKHPKNELRLEEISPVLFGIVRPEK